MGKENALQGVETFVFERFEVGIELGSEQELVDEGLVTFVGKVGCDHLREEPGILFPEEEVQLMAGELGIPGAFFLFLEIRPVEDELELTQGCVLPDGKQVTVSAGEILKNLKARGAQVLDLQALALLQEGDRVLFGEVAIRVESLAEAQVRDFGCTFRQGEFGVACPLMVEDEDVHVLAVPEGIEVDGEVALLVRLQVEKTDRAVDEEIDRAAGRNFLPSLFARRRRGCSSGLGGLAGQGAIVIFPIREGFLFRLGITHGPGIEDNLRAFEHVARQFPGIAPLKDVAEFVPDLATADVEVGQVAGGAAEESAPGGVAEESKEVEVRQEAGGNNVYAGGFVGIRHVDLQRLAVGGELCQVRGIPVDQLEGPGAVEDVPVGHHSPGNPEGDGLAALLEKEAVVAGFKVVGHEEAVLERQGLESV